MRGNRVHLFCFICFHCVDIFSLLSGFLKEVKVIGNQAWMRDFTVQQVIASNRSCILIFTPHHRPQEDCNIDVQTEEVGAESGDVTMDAPIDPLQNEEKGLDESVDIPITHSEDYESPNVTDDRDDRRLMVLYNYSKDEFKASVLPETACLSMSCVSHYPNLLVTEELICVPTFNATQEDLINCVSDI